MKNDLLYAKCLIIQKHILGRRGQLILQQYAIILRRFLGLKITRNIFLYILLGSRWHEITSIHPSAVQFLTNNFHFIFFIKCRIIYDFEINNLNLLVPHRAHIYQIKVLTILIHVVGVIWLIFSDIFFSVKIGLSP